MIEELCNIQQYHDIKFLILFSLIFALGVVAASQTAFADEPCKGDDDHCYSYIQSNAIEIEGIKYQLCSPDFYVDRENCEDVATFTGSYLQIYRVAICGAGDKTRTFDSETFSHSQWNTHIQSSRLS